MLHVVADEVGSPTYAPDLSRFIAELIVTGRYGIYHASNRGSCSRYKFAAAILREAGLDGVQIVPVSRDHYRLPAPRPKYSALDHQAIRRNGFGDLPLWPDALKRYMIAEGLP